MTLYMTKTWGLVSLYYHKAERARPALPRYHWEHGSKRKWRRWIVASGPKAVINTALGCWEGLGANPFSVCRGAFIIRAPDDNGVLAWWAQLEVNLVGRETL